MRLYTFRAVALAGRCAGLGLSGLALAQPTLADYQRGAELQAKARGLVIDLPSAVTWIGDSDRLWYTAEKVDGPLSLWVHPGADGAFSWYEDDGRSFDYRKGDSCG
jgi:hypothetical protein